MKADFQNDDVRFGSLADIAAALPNVRFTPESGHRLSAMNVRFSNRPVGVKRFQAMRRCCVDVAHGISRFLRALFQFSKRAAGEATKFGRSGVEFLGVVGAACLECDEPAAEAGELIGRQLGDNFGDLFDFHVAQYSTDGAWLSGGRINLRPPRSALGH